VEFGGEGVEVANYAFEFEGEVAVFFLELLVPVRVVGVGVAEGFDLYCSSISCSFLERKPASPEQLLGGFSQCQLHGTNKLTCSGLP